MAKKSMIARDAKRAELCDKYAEKDSRVKVIHKENGGLSDARIKEKNRCWRYGSYV